MGRWVLVSAWVVVAFALVSCGDDGTVPPVEDGGRIRVTVQTVGDALDPDGYTVTLNGESPRTLMINDTTVYESLAYGDYAVLLAGIAGNCVVNQNPWMITAVSEALNEAPFGVACVVP